MSSSDGIQYRDPAEVRRRKIVSIAARQGFIRHAEIAAELEVSSETIRRDLTALHQSGELRRVHGGAVVGTQVASVEQAREVRSSASTIQKDQIGRIAASLISDEDTVFLDVGTTAEATARALPATFRGVVITPSMPVASILGMRDSLELHLLGGKVRPRELTTYGEETVAQIAGFNATVALLGTGGVSVRGVSDFSGEDGALKRAMIQQSQQVFVLATAEKLGRTAPRNVCGLDAITGVISDSEATAESVDLLRDAGVRVFTPSSLPEAAPLAAVAQPSGPV